MRLVKQRIGDVQPLETCSIQTQWLAFILDHAFESMGMKTSRGPVEIVEAFLRQERQKFVQLKLKLIPVFRAMSFSQMMPWVSQVRPLILEDLREKSRRKKAPSELFVQDQKLSAKLVNAFVRRQEFRGCDVRLDVGSLYRPDSFPRASVNSGRWLWHVGQSYEFKEEDHINVLELKALVNSFE